MLPYPSVGDVRDPSRWGLSVEAVAELAERLQSVHSRFAPCFATKTRDSSRHAYTYLRGILTMSTQRNFANIARRVIDPEQDGQDLQQFISDSPWSAQAVFDTIQSEIVSRRGLHGGTLTLDESADERAGTQSAGSARQYLGREGKTDVGQVGVALGYYACGVWAMVDAELYLPKVWFDEAHASLRKRWHIPKERAFATKPQLGLAMIRHAKANGLPFSMVSCDALYGGNHAFRAGLNAEGLLYMADTPTDTQVYLHKPLRGVPPTPPGKRGHPLTRVQVLSEEPAILVRDLVADPHTHWQRVPVRHTERGLLTYSCAARRVWTFLDNDVPQQEWLFLRLEEDGTYSFSFSNAPTDTPLDALAQWRCERYFAERTFQDAKSEAGWDELVARKYRAWMHHTALDALALWFVAETKLDWASDRPPDPTLRQQLQVEVLPALSMANVREMLTAALPLPQLSAKQAVGLVTKHLVNRSHATACRLRQQRSKPDT